MKIVPVMLRSMSNGLFRRSRVLCSTRMLSTGANRGNDTGGRRDSDSFEQGTFGGTFQGSSKNDLFFQKMDKLGQSKSLDFTTFSDGIDARLERAAEDLGDGLEVDFSFRDDITLNENMNWTTYEPKDLDLKQPAQQPYVARQEFKVTTKEVLSRADFRNVRFLANFITEAGIIIKRSQSGISAKAQRKVAREIKTARAFGLMPFTTMGTKSFVFGKTMEDHNEDFMFQNYYWNTDNAPRK